LLLCGLTLASCSRAATTLPVAPQSAGSDSTPLRSGYKLLYRFTGAPSGSEPTGSTYLKGLLYGTTTGGGTKTLGTVFVRGVSRKVRVLYSFHGGDDGAEPAGTLLAFNGTLYGTTEYGGANGDGTVFAVSPAGKEHVIYSFKGGSDGATPLLTGLVALDGKLYGTTNAGGDESCHYQDIVGCGTVFAVSTSGRERVLYRFKGKPDGACPSGSLIAVGSTLYGTTDFGGTYNNGSAFTLTTSGDENKLYSFKGYPDGAAPFAGLTALNGTFYGTTTLGGAYDGAGTVFELSASGTERVLHSFKGAPDGALPYAALTVENGALYGTTEFGGSSFSACVGEGIVGCGTIFRVASSGDVSILYRFKGRRDGSHPLSSLAIGKGELLGTTLSGGTSDNGTIFEIAP
jgi:uncharacterized repeat protein (TIGR03803 family)